MRCALNNAGAWDFRATSQLSNMFIYVWGHAKLPSDRVVNLAAMRRTEGVGGTAAALGFSFPSKLAWQPQGPGSGEG